MFQSIKTVRNKFLILQIENLIQNFAQSQKGSTVTFTAFTYRDDTSSIVQAKNIKEAKAKLENVLRFMASNGLVSNPTKTTLMILNHKKEKEVGIMVGGNEICQERFTKLLGMTIKN